MDLYPPLSKELARKRAQLAPEISAAFKAFSQRVLRRGRAAHEDQAVDRGRGGARDPMSVLHSRPHRACGEHGATEQEVMEAIWVAAEMRAGGAYAHATLALETMNQMEAGRSGGGTS